MDENFLLAKLGPTIRCALNDDLVNEIILNPDGNIWLQYQDKVPACVGQMTRHDAISFAHGLAQYTNQYLNDKNPYLDAVLPFNQERINLTVPPIVDGVSFNIRKRTLKHYDLSDYQKSGVLTPHQAIYLYEAIERRQNILVSGGPGSGKTTFVNSLLKAIDTIETVGHRILILEQVPELICESLNHKVMMTTDKLDLRTLLWLSMRQSPERIVVGEVRDGAALDLLKAWNTGCPGGLATIHANSPIDAIQRILDLALEVCLQAPVRLAGQTINVIVQLTKDKSHEAGRYVSSIIEVNGYDEMNKQFLTTQVGGNNHAS